MSNHVHHRAGAALAFPLAFPLILGAILMAAVAPAHAAADDAIATDRPDFVESSNVVGKGRMQVETSLAMDRNSDVLAGIVNVFRLHATVAAPQTGAIGHAPRPALTA